MKDKLYIVLILTFYLQGCTSENRLNVNENVLALHSKDLPKDLFFFDIITMNIYPNDSLTTVLYGNEIAFDYAKKNRIDSYPIGSVLYGVTWKLKGDEYWFGATIPSRISKIERIEITANNKTKYRCFDYDQDKHLNKMDVQKRIAHIKGMKMAIHP